MFVEEQGVPPDEEIDAHDRDDPIAVHALVRDPSGTPVGTGRYYVTEPGVVQIGRMAVLAETRGTPERVPRSCARSSTRRADAAIGAPIFTPRSTRGNFIERAVFRTMARRSGMPEFSTNR